MLSLGFLALGMQFGCALYAPPRQRRIHSLIALCIIAVIIVFTFWW